MPGLPALLQLLVVFAVIVFATFRKVHIGLAAALGGVLLALWRGLGIGEVSSLVITEVFRLDTILLVALMACIMAFSSAMKKSGAMAKFSASIGEISPSTRAAMVTTPLLIGTLPMPGGAILSAPLVESLDHDHKLSSVTLTAANFWFRHMLELFWPLYPAFILTTSLSGIPVTRLMLLNIYSLPVLAVLGLTFILPGKREKGAFRVAPARGSAPSKVLRAFTDKAAVFIRGAAPLILVVGTYIALAIIWSALSSGLAISNSAKALIGRYPPILLGLLAGSLFIGFGASGFASFKNCITASTVKLIAVIIGIRVFSALLSGAGVAQAAAEELASAGIPSIFAVALIPLITGLVTGVGLGYVGLAFPIVLGLVPEGGPFPREAAIVLAGAFGYAGMMLSPLHSCLVVSVEHFKSSLPATIRKCILPTGIFLVVAMLYVALLAILLG
ncbi:MAG: hypothetical protein CVV53_02990 [Spirochaetae bacterium HGW-Spirochaetae-9]|nr:MAG: hypothetical protein CVV53_02990 [Spirochaetae bacterium HGW-Spirochaetae-9]